MSDVTIERVVQAARGSHATRERVELRNRLNTDIDLSGWRIGDDDRHRYTIPSGTTLRAGGLLRIWTGSGSEPGDLHMDRKAAIWNNDGDRMLLTDAEGKPIHRHAYGVASWAPLEVAEDELCRHHAPVLRFHSREQYFPSTVDWYLERVAVFRDGDQIADDVDVDTVAHHATGAQLDKSLTLRIESEQTRQGQPASSAPAYTRALQRLDLGLGITDLQYWFFYPYSGDITPGVLHFAHEGDWEHVTVRVRDETVIAVYTSAHEEGEHRWHPPERVGWDGTHPEVYVAKHSHAAYVTRGEQHRNHFPSDHTDHLGERARTENHLVPLVPNPAWLRFNGLWGRPGALRHLDTDVLDTWFTSGPSGPAFKSLWQGAKHGPPGWICFHGDDGFTGDVVAWVRDRDGGQLTDITNDEIRSATLFDVRPGAVIDLYNDSDGDRSKGRCRITVKAAHATVGVSRIDRPVDRDEVTVRVTGDEIIGKVSRIEVH
ncbi:lamin tail domain-containing protein [Microbacterium ureisolvens]|uniref:lamin tail domain-containing protein n=1 Tax=Microbacterium ureisolvens TaxID=2781186 RepID=UPI0036421C67